TSFDTTIPVYKGAEMDDIENFLFDYEGYIKVKKYDKETTCFRVYMHMPESMRIYEAHTESIDMKLRSDEKRNWYIQGLRESFCSKVENCCPKDYDKAKKKALGIDEYKRERNQNQEGDKFAKPVTSSKTDIDINSLVNELAALKINHIEQED
ncbi:1637_t:CDS:2, partial [Cetraspora pellucida]